MDGIQGTKIGLHLAHVIVSRVPCPSCRCTEGAIPPALSCRPPSHRPPAISQPHRPSLRAGFWGVHDKMQIANPGAAEGSDWAAKAGQDFVHHHNMPVVDFATMHLWPDNWLTKNTSFVAEWIHKHIEDSTKVLKKPVLLEE